MVLEPMPDEFHHSIGVLDSTEVVGVKYEVAEQIVVVAAAVAAVEGNQAVVAVAAVVVAAAVVA